MTIWRLLPFTELSFVHIYIYAGWLLRDSYSYKVNILGFVCILIKKIDLQSHPWHPHYPEVQANLCLPSLQAHPGVRSGQLNLDDPEVGRGGEKQSAAGSETRSRESSQSETIFALIMKLTNMNHIDFSFILPSFVISRKRKQLLKVKGRRKKTTTVKGLCSKSGQLPSAAPYSRQ